MNTEQWKATIRVYTPREIFHERRSYFVRRKNGDTWLQLSFHGWAILFGISKYSIAMPFFMFVDRKDNETP